MFRFLFQFAVFYAILNVYLVSSECKFDSDTEKKYQDRLSLLQKERIVIQDGKYIYTIGICTPVTNDSVGVTQQEENKENGGVHSLGRINSAHIQVGNDWMLLQYDDGDEYQHSCNSEARQSDIMIICDENNQLLGSTTIIEENNDREKDCYYLFEVTSNIACTHKQPSGLSLGSILIILFICICFVYIVGGFVYQRFIIGAKGAEQFPNIAFWRDFGNLVADGCDFVFRSSSSDDSPVYRGLGDEDLGLEHNTIAMDQDDDDDDIQPLY